MNSASATFYFFILHKLLADLIDVVRDIIVHINVVNVNDL